MEVSRGGKFSHTIGSEQLSVGLRRSKRNPRNSGFMVSCQGAVGRDKVLQILDEVSRLATTIITDGFPYPQIFIFSNMIIVCSATTIYEYEGGSLVAKHSTSAGDIWTAVAFHDYVYMSNNKVVVIRSAEDKTYSETDDLPINLAACNYNGQVIIYAPEVNPPPAGNLYGCGLNEYNQLGIEDKPIGYNSFTAISPDSWISISSGYIHSAVVKNDGTLWVTGSNTNGQLGLGDTITRYDLTQVGSATDWSSVYCGAYYTYAVKTNGEVWATGANSSGQLGLGDTTQRTSFSQVSVTDFESLACGYSHVLLIKTDGTLWVTGDNSLGQIGLGATASVDTLTQVGSDTDYASASGGELHSAIIKDDGSLYTTGYNPYGELGFPAYEDKTVFTLVGTGWSRISCGSYFTLVIKTDGTLWGAGNNSDGQLGLGATGSVDSFTQIGSDSDWSVVDCETHCTIVIKTGGEVWITGTNYYGEAGTGDHIQKRTALYKISGTFANISVGRYHSLALDSDGILYGTGYSYNGQIGIGSNIKISQLTLCNGDMWDVVNTNYNHTVAIKDDGTLWGVGEAAYGAIGLGSSHNYLVYKFIQISSAKWSQCATGMRFTSAFKDGEVWVTGHNQYGQLGLGDNTHRYELTQISGSDWSFIAAGGYGTMSIKTDGTLWATGRNSGTSAGKLGLGDSVDRNTFTQTIGTGWKQCSLGNCHSAAVRSDGTLWATGRNVNGELGLGDNTFRNIWTQVAGSDWDYVECGADYTLAVKINGALYSTGKNSSGQLGLGDETNRNEFTLIGISGGGSFSGRPLFGGGSRHSLSIVGSILKSTGGNTSGQLAIGSVDAGRSSFDSISQSAPDRGADSWNYVVLGRYHTMAIRSLI